MLTYLTDWMNGPFAGKTMLVLRIVFFVLFIVTSLFLCFPRGGKGKNSYLLLSVFFSLALAAVFCYQAVWQLTGTSNVELMRFMRRHNRRPNVEIRRGSVLDRNNTVLAADDTSAKGQGMRKYPLGPVAAHVVGYYDPRFGLSGIEKAADDKLTGIGGTKTDELKRLGMNIIDSRPAEGGDVRLTIDARLQRKAADLMADRRGAVVVMRPDNGELLTLFSWPSFDPSQPGGFYGDAEDAPFLNRAVQGKYPAGSTFKVAMASIAANNRMSPVYDTPPGGFSAAKGARPIRDVEYYSYQREGRVWNGFGRIGMKDALVHSSNVYFAQLGVNIPPDSFNGYIEGLGINSKIPLYADGDSEYSASPGSVETVTAGDRRMRAQLAIGQGTMAVSPLHVAMWTSVVASGGLLYPPHLGLDGAAPIGPAKRIISQASADNVRLMMREAVRKGTGRNADIPGAGVCGKTGTAQAPGGKDHSWFTCFTADTKPRLVVTVIVERGGYGSRSALPVAKGMIEEAIKLGIASLPEAAKNGGGK